MAVLLLVNFQFDHPHWMPIHFGWRTIATDRRIIGFLDIVISNYRIKVIRIKLSTSYAYIGTFMAYGIGISFDLSMLILICPSSS